MVKRSACPRSLLPRPLPVGTTALDYQSLIERTDTPADKPAAKGSKGSSGTEWAGTTDPSAASKRMWFIKLGGGKNPPLMFLPRGFAQMTVMDLHEFNRKTYTFEFVRQEFLGDVRCMVFDVAPIDRKQPGKFLGRIWVEDRDDSIVRFKANGTYTFPQAAEEKRGHGIVFPLR